MDDKLSLQQLTPRRFLHPVPYWATLHRHHGLKSVSSIWCRRQTEPSAHRHLANCALERNGRNVVALVDNHEPVAGRYLREVVSAGKTLNHRQVDHTTRLPLRTDLSDALLVETEVCGQAVSPLFDEGLAIDDHQSGHTVKRD
jgi:hypothetical protein